MTTSDLRRVERLTLVAPLGLRPWDTVTGSVAGEGLRVVAYPKSRPDRRTEGFANRSGVYVVSGLPGLRAAEQGAGDDEYWRDVARLPFVVEVMDPQRRFLPCSFEASLPQRGLLGLACLPSDAAPAQCIPLYSSTTRALPAAMAILRAELHDAADDGPAAWALVEARYATAAGSRLLARSVADESGRVTLCFAYPEPQGFATAAAFDSPPGLSSPPGGPRRMAEQRWPIQLNIFSSRSRPAPAIPDLCAIFAQAPALALDSRSPAEPLAEVEVTFGQERTVSTAGESALLVVTH